MASILDIAALSLTLSALLNGLNRRTIRLPHAIGFWSWDLPPRCCWFCWTSQRRISTPMKASPALCGR
jgi:hypothetical protein